MGSSTSNMDREDGKDPFDYHTYYAKNGLTIATMIEFRAFGADFFERHVRPTKRRLSPTDNTSMTPSESSGNMVSTNNLFEGHSLIDLTGQPPSHFSVMGVKSGHRRLLRMQEYRGSTPDSEALASSDDEQDHHHRLHQVTSNPGPVPAHHPSWLTET